MAIYQRVCIHCGKTFKTDQPCKKICSRECRLERKGRRRGEWGLTECPWSSGLVPATADPLSGLDTGWRAQA